MHNRVFVLDVALRPLMPCTAARARALLRAGKAAIYRRVPFTIRLKAREGGEVQPLAAKFDPGAEASGVALVAGFAGGPEVVFAAEIEHRAREVKASLEARRSLRRGRRQRHTRYRPPRFQNRRRPAGWLPPSLHSRIANLTTWARRLARWTPVARLALERVRWDPAVIRDPEAAEYRPGTLPGYEVREYLLDKWGRACVYCGKADVPLRIDHILARAAGGSDHVSNLTVACEPCDRKKADRPIEAFLAKKPELLAKILARARESPRDVPGLVSSRAEILRQFEELGLPVEPGSGGRTKFNRTRGTYPWARWIDAACVGPSGAGVRLDPAMHPLRIKATGRSNRRFRLPDKYGFPRRRIDGQLYDARPRARVFGGFQTGDLVRGRKASGKYKGVHVGRVSMRSSGTCDLNGVAFAVSSLSLLQHADGYKYAFGSRPPRQKKTP